MPESSCQGHRPALELGQHLYVLPSFSVAYYTSSPRDVKQFLANTFVLIRAMLWVFWHGALFRGAPGASEAHADSDVPHLVASSSRHPYAAALARAHKGQRYATRSSFGKRRRRFALPAHSKCAPAYAETVQEPMGGL